MSHKITAKQWAGYRSMLSEPLGPSFNDGYNLQEHGITANQFYALLRLAEGAAGIDGKKLTRKQLQDLLNGKRVCLSYANPSDVATVEQVFS